MLPPFLVDTGAPNLVEGRELWNPNGIALEASYWVDDATARDADLRDQSLFSDADPVPAVRELIDAGELASTPVTRLS